MMTVDVVQLVTERGTIEMRAQRTDGDQNDLMSDNQNIKKKSCRYITAPFSQQQQKICADVIICMGCTI
jgi:hypothetical protein